MTLDDFDLQYIGATGCSPEEAADFRQQTLEGKKLTIAAQRASLLRGGKPDAWEVLLGLLEAGAEIGADAAGLKPLVEWAKGLA